MDYLAAVHAFAGLEPGYRAKLLKTEVVPCNRYEIFESPGSWAAVQYDLPSEGRGVAQITVRDGSKDGTAELKLHGLHSTAAYTLQAYTSAIAPQNLWGPGQMPMLDDAKAVDPVALGISAQVTGQELGSKGLTLKLGTQPQVTWIIYSLPRKAKT